MVAALPLTPAQLRTVDGWFGHWELREDLSWGIQGIHVLRIATRQGPVVVKASEVSQHIVREVRAHRQMTGPLLDLAPTRTPRMLHADTRAGVLATTWLPGRLVEGGAHERSEEAFRQAGTLLSLVHVPRSRTASYDPAALAKIADFLNRAQGLAPRGQLRAVAALAASHRPEPRWLFATHGDYTPRNWILDDDPSAGGVLHVIDWGRAGYRPWVTDLVRLEHQWFQHHGFQHHPQEGFPQDAARTPGTHAPRSAADRSRAHDGAGLRAAFYAGYGREPAEEPDSWRLDNLLQALGTIVWSHEVGDAEFEEEGRRMLARAVEWFG